MRAAQSYTHGGIDCATASGATSGDCSAAYDSASVVTLTTQVAAGSVFTGWSGPLMGTGTCQVSMAQDQTVTANFAVQCGGTMPLRVALQRMPCRDGHCKPGTGASWQESSFLHVLRSFWRFRDAPSLPSQGPWPVGRPSHYQPAPWRERSC